MPDGTSVACANEKIGHEKVWSPADVTCSACLTRMRKFPQLVNAIMAARQLSIADIVMRGATS